MQDSFDILEEKVKKAAELVKKLRRDNKGLDDQLKDSKAKLAEAEKKLREIEREREKKLRELKRRQGDR